MALQIFTSNDTGSGIRAALGETDSAIIYSDVTIGSTNARAIVGTGNSHAVSIAGNVTGWLPAVQLGDNSANDYSHVLSVETGGSVTSFAHAAVLITGYDSTIVNKGTISSLAPSASAVSMVGDRPEFADMHSKLVNEGLIEGQSVGFTKTGTENVIIENSGTIKGSFASVISESATQLFNEGSLLGNVLLSSENDIVDTTGGRIDGHVYLGEGYDRFLGSAYDDIVDGMGHGDQLYGRAGADRLGGGTLNDILHGGAGNDYLDGGTEDDELRGDAGRDTLTGGAGKDVLRGGADADMFVFRSLDDSGDTLDIRDMIVDFSHRQRDRIDLSAIDAKSSTTANDAFVFIGDEGFNGREGEVRAYQTGGYTRIYADVDGDKHADLALWLNHEIGLKSSDFAL